MHEASPVALDDMARLYRAYGEQATALCEARPASSPPKSARNRRNARAPAPWSDHALRPAGVGCWAALGAWTPGSRPRPPACPAAAGTPAAATGPATHTHPPRAAGQTARPSAPPSGRTRACSSTPPPQPASHGAKAGQGAISTWHRSAITVLRVQAPVLEPALWKGRRIRRSGPDVARTGPGRGHYSLTASRRSSSAQVRASKARAPAPGIRQCAPCVRSR